VFSRIAGYRHPARETFDEPPDQHDYDDLSIIYSHLDSTTTIGQTKQGLPSAMTDVD